MSDVIRKQVKSINFSLISPEQIKKIGVVKVVTPELYDMDGYPVDGGLMDLKLGAIDPGVRCRTCGGRLKECLGHFGYIELARPIMHIKYIPIIELVLRTTCSVCGKLLLQNALEYPLVSRVKKAKDTKKCPFCSSIQEKIKLEKPTSFYAGSKRVFPTEVRERLAKVSDDDLKLLGINPKFSRPEWGVLTLLLVPPVTIRPSITLETGERSEDDLTHKLGDIVRANQRLWENLNAGAPEVIIEDLWDLLQYHVTTFFDNSVTQIPPARHRSGQPLKTITERIKGKEGRIRHNLAGKRVNFSSRTVISPDPFMKVNEIGVPFDVAKVITVNETVTSSNIEAMKKLILATEYPAANYVIRPDGKRKRVTPDLQEEISEELAPGYKVERQLKDGDILLFNRHPSLHKASLMAHYAKILAGRTFRLHPTATFPYNADFDGDEMNIHSPQTEEARAEAIVLLDVKNQLISPKNNTNVLGCIGDAITGNYILSTDELSKEDANQLVVESGIDDTINEKNVEGKRLFSNLLGKINFEKKTKACLGEDCPNYKNCKEEKCPNNAYIRIKDGKLLSGVVDKYAFGVEDGVMLKMIHNDIGTDKTIEILRKAFALGSLYLSRNGFSIALQDIKVPEHVRMVTDNVVKDAERKVESLLNAYYTNTLDIVPGKTKEETREVKILQTLNEVRTKIGETVRKDLEKTNPLYKMILSGAGGNVVYITQMACCVGQQSLWAKRIDLGYSDRTLSFFKKNDLSPKSKGFVYSSFLSGLRPYEFFFGAITGRDSLMDTALRTPKSGYLYRRLSNALQDLKVEYDGTVRDASGNIIQFAYGEDGSDVSKLHLKNKKIDPAEAIGIITAQSFGEPSTQMTLNVFHFAGISEMQITQGLPRLIELFDARKKPSTPAMEIHLEKEYNNEENAKVMAEKIKEVKIKEIASSITVNFSDKKLEIMLDKEAIKRLHTSIDTIVKRLNEKKEFNARATDNKLIVKAEKLNFKELYRLKEKIKEEIVSGIKGIEQVLPVKRESEYVILTAGSNLAEIFKFKGVDKDRTTTNDVYEVYELLGIEAAREAMIKEIVKVITNQGLDIDERHIKLVVDAITYLGEIKGITRMGIIREKSSILARASFETPIKHFVNATLRGQKDELASVIENVILNQPIPVGTGLPGLLVKITGKLSKASKKEEKE
ncbi:DNA-directed RNA polymerase subunit A' [Candidatus Pacearchaeota archaeon]|nr:DNA-directed RNA polymerase subunit A' [Candidatus Pacearchaeota archaeon]